MRMDWKQLNQRGIVLIASYLAVAVLLLLQSAYYSRIVEDQKLAVRQTEHLKSLHYADAALDRALVELTSNPGYTGTGSPVTLGTGAYSITVTDHPNDSTLKIVTTSGYYPGSPLTNPEAKREQVMALVKTDFKLFNYGLFGDEDLKMVGSTAVYGGYNSNLGELPQAPFLGAPADLGTNGTDLRDIWITGSLFGPYTTALCGQGTVLPPPNYCVQVNGSANWLGPAVLTAPNPLPTVTPPTPPYDPAGVILTISGGTYRFNLANPYVFQPAGYPVGRYAAVVNSLSVSGAATVLIDDPAITRLDVYVLSTLALAGSGTVGDTTTYKATQLIISYLGTSTVGISGGGTIIAGVFAKNAKCALTGSATVYGAVACKQIDGNGTFAFYFDEGLKSLSVGQNSAAELQVWKRQ